MAIILNMWSILKVIIGLVILVLLVQFFFGFLNDWLAGSGMAQKGLPTTGLDRDLSGVGSVDSNEFLKFIPQEFWEFWEKAKAVCLDLLERSKERFSRAPASP